RAHVQRAVNQALAHRRVRARGDHHPLAVGLLLLDALEQAFAFDHGDHFDVARDERGDGADHAEHVGVVGRLGDVEEVGMEGGEEGVAGGGEAVEEVEGVGDGEERYGEVDCGWMDGVAVRGLGYCVRTVGKVVEPVTPKHTHTQSLGEVPYCFRHDSGNLATEGCCVSLYFDSQLMDVPLVVREVVVG
ncbi:MAG: hypothetical protein LQ347_006981, partial [Umbilicaria vellea]